MYPTQELNELAWRKQAVRARIASHRLQCLESLTALEPTAALVDRGVNLWRSVSAVLKWMGLPLVMLAAQKVVPRIGGVKRLLRYVPVVLDLVETFFGSRERRARESEATQRPAGVA